MQEIARDLAVVTMTMSNAYLVGNARSWVLVDAGTRGNANKIKEAAEERFGPGAKPRAIVLTHGHFDHAGSSGSLAEMWGVRIYAHRLEWPYLTGKSSHPPLDPTAPGFFSFLARVLPHRTANIAEQLEELGNNLPKLGMEDWEALNTPGHTPGHVSFFRGSDGALLAGDALTTMNLDSFLETMSKRKQVCRPPVPATTDWQAARKSVKMLAELGRASLRRVTVCPCPMRRTSSANLRNISPFPSTAGTSMSQRARMRAESRICRLLRRMPRRNLPRALPRRRSWPESAR